MPVTRIDGNVTFTNENGPNIGCALTISSGVTTLVVAIRTRNAGVAISGVTFNGVAMQVVGIVNPGGLQEMYLLALENPSIGTFVLNMNVSQYSRAVVMWAGYAGTVSGAGYGSMFAANDTSAQPSLGSQTCPAGGMLFGAMWHAYSAAEATTTAGVVISNVREGAGGNLYSAADRNTTGALSWLVDTSNMWRAVGLPLLGTAGPDTPPGVSNQPAVQSVVAPNTATFSVTATGTAPLAYQWRRNGTNIVGATSSSYTTPPTAVQPDNGALYSVVVSNAAGSVTSDNATLVVLAAPDVTPPTLSGTIAVTALSSTGGTITCPVATDAVGVAGYQWRLSTSGGWTTIAGGGRSATITGRTPGATETVQMRAFDTAPTPNYSTELSRSVTWLTAATFAFTSESMFFATDTGPQLSRAVSWALWYGVLPSQAGIAALPTTPAVAGTGTTSATDGTLRVTGLAAAGQALLMVADGDGGVYLQSVTAA